MSKTIATRAQFEAHQADVALLALVDSEGVDNRSGITGYDIDAAARRVVKFQRKYI